MKRNQVTINDVAELAGVSRATVSLVNQAHPRIPKETGDRVREAMISLGYTYNRAAANLRSRTSQALGLIINDIRNPFFAELTSAVQEAAATKNFLVYLAESAEDLKRQEVLVGSFAEHAIAGLIICPAIGTTKQSFRVLQNCGIPICTVIRKVDEANCDFVGSDDLEASRLATQHLIHKGCKRIAYVGGESVDPVRRDRYAGYALALKKARLKIHPELDFQGRLSRENTVKFMKSIADQHKDIDAIVCHNDFTSIAALHGLRLVGVQAGIDVAVIGFDGTNDAEITCPPASTMWLHGDLIGQDAVQLLLQRIENPARKRVDVIQPHDLIVRDSSATFKANI